MAETSPGGDQANTPGALEFEITVLASDASEDELDQMTRNLLSELRETEIDSASLVSVGAAPEGSKGDPITIGTLAMTVLPAALPGVIDVIKDWITRRQGRTVKFKGKGIEFEGSLQDLEKLLARLEQEKKKR